MSDRAVLAVRRLAPGTRLRLGSWMTKIAVAAARTRIKQNDPELADGLADYQLRVGILNQQLPMVHCDNANEWAAMAGLTAERNEYKREIGLDL